MAPIQEWIAADRPFLGICIGFQMLFESSTESPGARGIAAFPGSVVRFPDSPGLKVPHMGWNEIKIVKDTPVLYNIPQDSWFYFVHSYYPAPEDNIISAVKTTYGFEFTSAVSESNIFASQFHPEKSSTLGLKMVQNFSTLCGGSIGA